MKELSKNERKRIAYNCRKATMLIEKKQITSISAVEQFELNLHLAGCSVCRLFEQQSKQINHLFKALFFTSTNQAKLGEPFKQKLQNQINEKRLDHNL